MSQPTDDRLVLISCDGHAGADLLDYKAVPRAGVPRRVRRVGRRRSTSRGPSTTRSSPTPTTSASASVRRRSCRRTTGTARSDSSTSTTRASRRRSCSPTPCRPSTPSGVISAWAPRNAEEYRLRQPGVQAHNRWLVDFCAEAPGRRAGLAQVFLNDVDDAIAEVRWAKEHGLKGVLIPSDHMSQLVNLYEPAPRSVLGGVRGARDAGAPPRDRGRAAGASRGAGAAAASAGTRRIMFFQRGLSQLISVACSSASPTSLRVHRDQPAWMPRELVPPRRRVRMGRQEGQRGLPHAPRRGRATVAAAVGVLRAATCTSARRS